MRFWKWHALGNSYLVVERAQLGGPLEPELAARLCDPRYGIGSDGVLEIALRERATTRYAIEGAAGEPRVVLIEHPVRRGWRLVGPDAERVETTGEQYRIR